MRLIFTPGELSCLAARRARDFAPTFRPFKTEGVGNAGCPVHPQPRARWVVKYAHECSQRRHRNHPAFPHANGFNGFLRALPGDEFLFVTIASRIERLRAPGWAAKTSARLDTSNGCQDHTTSPSATPSKKAARWAWYQSRRSLSEGGSAPSSGALDDRSRSDPPCEIVAPDAAASTASRSNVRDDRDTPLMRDGMRKR
jgi:hypothetical protein